MLTSEQIERVVPLRSSLVPLNDQISLSKFESLNASTDLGSP